LANVGPFSYNRTFVDKKTEASYSMGAKLESSLVNKHVVTPAPNIYNPITTFSKMKAPEYKIGTSKRGVSYDTRKAALVPPPGCYDMKSVAFEGLAKPKFHMG
jgi:hypothetical protein